MNSAQNPNAQGAESVDHQIPYPNTTKQHPGVQTQNGPGNLQLSVDLTFVAMTRSVLHPHPHQNHVFSLFSFSLNKNSAYNIPCRALSDICQPGEFWFTNHPGDDQVFSLLVRVFVPGICEKNTRAKGFASEHLVLLCLAGSLPNSMPGLCTVLTQTQLRLTRVGTCSSRPAV